MYAGKYVFAQVMAEGHAAGSGEDLDVHAGRRVCRLAAIC